MMTERKGPCMYIIVSQSGLSHLSPLPPTLPKSGSVHSTGMGVLRAQLTCPGRSHRTAISLSPHVQCPRRQTNTLAPPFLSRPMTGGICATRPVCWEGPGKSYMALFLPLYLSLSLVCPPRGLSPPPFFSFSPDPWDRSGRPADLGMGSHPAAPSSGCHTRSKEGKKATDATKAAGAVFFCFQVHSSTPVPPSHPVVAPLPVHAVLPWAGRGDVAAVDQPLAPTMAWRRTRARGGWAATMPVRNRLLPSLSPCCWALGVVCRVWYGAIPRYL